MKKYLLTTLAVFTTYIINCQVFSGSQEIDKGNREGAYVLSNLDQKFVEKVWTGYLSKLGKPLESKGTYTIKDGKLATLSDSPILFYSKIVKQKVGTVIFLSANLANGDIVTNGHAKWADLGKFLTDFQEALTLHDAARIAENNLADASENHKKTVKAGDKLKEKIEDNKKEKERLLKRIEENKMELEKLLTDTETNKKDQIKAIDDLAVKKVLLDEAKKKIN